MSLEAEVYEIQTQAGEFQIFSTSDLERVAVLLREIKRRKSVVVEHHRPMKEAANKAHKSACAAEDDAESDLKGKVGQYEIALSAARVAQLQASQEQAEAEERARREVEAKELRRQGPDGRAAAKELIAAPLAVAVAAPLAPQKVAGISTRMDYDFEVVNALLVPRDYLIVDYVALRKVVKALKENCRIPGIQVVKVPVTRAI